MNSPPTAPALVPETKYSGMKFPMAYVRNVQTNAARKYHSVTYIGPVERMIGATKLMATSSSPNCATGSIQTGVSPHSTPWPGRARIPTAVESDHHLPRAKDEHATALLSKTGFSVSRGRPNASTPRKAFAKNP